MKVDGVAWATVIAQYSGLILSIAFILYKYSYILKYFDYHSILNKLKLKKFFGINADIFLRTLLLIFVMSFFTAKSAEINDETLAANFILMQLWLIIAYGVDGFAFAAESLVGKYLGSNNRYKFVKTVKLSCNPK